MATMKLKYFRDNFRIFLLMISVILVPSCKHENNPISGSIAEMDWLIDETFIRRGCSGLDCIPSIQSPNKSQIGGDHLEFLDDDDLVVGIWDGTHYTAYPQSILDWHEIVNEAGFAISYCPLTGSAIHFTKENTSFGVSGLLYNSNLIMYDRKTGSYWPQMFLKSAAGAQQGNAFELQPLLETTWKTWKSLFPESRVVNANTGYSRNYNLYPYGSYKSCNSATCRDYIYFPVQNTDNRLPAKERVLTFISNEKVMAYPITMFVTPTVLRETMGEQTFTFIFSATEDIAIGFETDLTFSISDWYPDSGSLFLTDSETGSTWNLLGKAVDGSLTGEQLNAAQGFIAYWFAAAAYFPEIQIYN